MAISYQSTQIQGWDNTLNRTHLVSKPTGTAEGDLLLAIAWRNGADATGDTINLPTDFIEIDSYYTEEDGGGTYGGGFLITGYKIAGVGDAAISQYSFSLNGGGGSTSNWYTSISRFTGVLQSDPIGDHAMNDDLSGLLQTLPGLIPEAANSVYVLAMGNLQNNDTVVSYSFDADNPTWTQVFDTKTSNGQDTEFAIAYSDTRVSSAFTDTIKITLDSSAASILTAIELKEAPPLDIQMTAGVIQLTGTSDISLEFTMSPAEIELSSGTIEVVAGLIIPIDAGEVELIGEGTPVIDYRWEDQTKNSSAFTNSAKNTESFTNTNKSTANPFTPINKSL